MDQPRQGLKIHDCSELPRDAELSRDADCLKHVVQTSGLSVWRGSGQYWFVIKLDAMTVKVGTVKETELRIACQLNGLADETPVFPHTYGWLVCDSMPNRWRALLRYKKPDHNFLLDPAPSRFLFTFVQVAEPNWEDASFSEYHGYRTALFFLLHALYVARRRFGFRHGNLHSGNIMLQCPRSSTRRPEGHPTPLRYAQTEAQVTSNWVPRLINYGQVSAAPDAGCSDLAQLRKVFEQRLDVDPKDVAERSAFSCFVASSGWRDCDDAEMFAPLLDHDYFDVPEIRRQRVKRQVPGPIQRCFVCCACSPGFRIFHELAAPKYFCDHHCYQSIDGIVSFIK